MTIPTLVTVAQAREQLNEVSAASDAGLQLKIDAATQLVCEYIQDRQPADPDWIAEIESWDGTESPSSVPAVIAQAVLIQVAELYRFRGDDEDGAVPKGAESGDLAPQVTRMLKRYRSPSLA